MWRERDRALLKLLDFLNSLSMKRSYLALHKSSVQHLALMISSYVCRDPFEMHIKAHLT